jgi:hypothetical protein
MCPHRFRQSFQASNQLCLQPTRQRFYQAQSQVMFQYRTQRVSLRQFLLLDQAHYQLILQVCFPHQIQALNPAMCHLRYQPDDLRYFSYFPRHSLRLILRMFRREYQLRCRCRCQQLDHPADRRHRLCLNRQRFRQAIQHILHLHFQQHVLVTRRYPYQAPILPPPQPLGLLSLRYPSHHVLPVDFQPNSLRFFRLRRRPGFLQDFQPWCQVYVLPRVLRHIQRSFLPASLPSFQHRARRMHQRNFLHSFHL